MNSSTNYPPLLTGIVHTDRLVVFGGGYPLLVNEATVGGIGISGGHSVKIWRSPKPLLSEVLSTTT